MGRVQSATQSELTRTLADNLRELWDAYLRGDEAAHSALLADEYRAVHPDGTVHLGKPTAQQIAAAPIEDYWLTQIRAWPVGEEGAIVTYTAEVEIRSGLSAKRFKFEVGEVWIKQHNHWKCRYYHATTRT